jgi:hypothetical protein
MLLIQSYDSRRPLLARVYVFITSDKLPLSSQTTAGSSGTQQQLTSLPHLDFSAACQDRLDVKTELVLSRMRIRHMGFLRQRWYVDQLTFIS